MLRGLRALSTLAQLASSRLPTVLLEQPQLSGQWPHFPMHGHAMGCMLRQYAAGADADKLLHFCVVGSGPAGFYTVSQLLKSFGERARVAVVERLPTPFGLVRSGVAPDHPETKNVINQFTQLGQDARVSYFGNVNVGADVPLSTLRTLFHGVILAYGAESNQVLNIPGRHLEGILTAREFVWWYNGHPEYCNLPIDLRQTRRVSILGLGNVSLDCARILLQPPERLQTTDIADHALEQLRHSSVEQVDIIGRRGPAQVAFTAKELREVLKLDGIRVVVPQGDMALSDADQAELKASRSRKRVFELLQSADGASAEQGDAEKELRMHFYRTPVEAVAGDLGRVKGLKLERTKLVKNGSHQRAVATGEIEVLPADLVLESIGYRSLPLAGAPFDEQRGVIPNRQGRVLRGTEDSAAVAEGLYVCGWVKRGPSGIIGTNLIDASETVAAIAEDAQLGQLRKPDTGMGVGADGLLKELQQNDVQVVDFAAWQRIDAVEKQLGGAEGKPRQKLTDVQSMLQACS